MIARLEAIWFSSRNDFCNSEIAKSINILSASRSSRRASLWVNVSFAMDNSFGLQHELDSTSCTKPPNGLRHRPRALRYGYASQDKLRKWDCEAPLRSALWVWVCPFRGIAQHGQDWAPHHPGALPGRDNATLTGPTSSQKNCLKTRRVPLVGCTIGERERPLSAKKQRRNGSILQAA